MRPPWRRHRLRGRSDHPAGPLFARYGDEELVGLGVIASLLPALRRITDSRQLEAVLGHNLPGLTREVLLALHDGMESPEVRTFVTDQWRAGRESIRRTGPGRRAAPSPR